MRILCFLFFYVGYNTLLSAQYNGGSGSGQMVTALASSFICGEFFGGGGSGQDTTTIVSAVGCNSFFGGGGGGQDTENIVSTVGCIGFLGNSGSGAASIELKGRCVMYWGDSASGYREGLITSTQNCLFFKGEWGSGYNDYQLTNTFPCLFFRASASGNDGHSARSYSEDHAGGCYIATFPIEASPLFGEVRNDKNGYLYWKTYSELNNDGFEIHKSLDAVHWEAIGWVDGAGNSDEILAYEFTDTDLDAEIQYYRFLQVDFSGASGYSNIVALSLHSAIPADNIVQIYPNPVVSGNALHLQTWLHYSLDLKMQVWNSLGQSLYTSQYFFNAGNSQYALPTDILPSGTYFLSVEAPNRVLHWIIPFVVIH